MKSEEHLKRKELDRLKEISGDGTELISLYISPGSDIADYRNRMNQEVSEAENIKSKSTRKNVKAALKSVSNALQNYQKTPRNGLVIFSSADDTFVFDDLDTPIDSSRYRCDSTFYTEPLEESLGDSTTYGLLIITENVATVGTLEGNVVREKKSIESNLHGKHKAGGQSAQRFARDRKEKKKRFYREVADDAKRILDTDDMEGLIVGGTEITRKEFVDDEYLDHELRDAIIGQYNVAYTGRNGLNTLVKKAEDLLSEQELNEEKRLVDEFYDGLRDGNDAYGEERVREVAEHGRVETLLLSEEVEDAGDIAEEVEQKGGEVEYISTDFEMGQRFYDNFGGIGAILRW